MIACLTAKSLPLSQLMKNNHLHYVGEATSVRGTAAVTVLLTCCSRYICLVLWRPRSIDSGLWSPANQGLWPCGAAFCTNSKKEKRQKGRLSEEANVRGNENRGQRKEKNSEGLRWQLKLIDQEFSFDSFVSLPSLEVNSCGILALFLSSSVGVRHHERCRLLLHLCFPVNRSSKVKGHLVCFGTFGNASANPYLQNPVVRSQEDP